MAVDEEVGLDVEHVADDTLDGEAAAVELGAHVPPPRRGDDRRPPSSARALDPVVGAREHVVELESGPPMTSPSHGWERAAHQAAVSEALQALGIARLHLTIHDASFPAGADDVGRGTPYSDAARAFFGFTRALGFTGVQLGPQGLTARDNPSPYDAMLFSREPLSIYAAPLVGRDAWRALVGDVPWTTARRADHRAPSIASTRRSRALWRARRDAWAARRRRVRGAAARAGSARDAALDAMPPDEYRFVQWLAHRQHDELRAHLGAARPDAVGRPADRHLVARSAGAGAAVPRRLRHGRAAEPHQPRGAAVGLSGARSGAVRRRRRRARRRADGQAPHRVRRRCASTIRTASSTRGSIAPDERRRRARGGARRRAALLVARPARSSAPAALRHRARRRSSIAASCAGPTAGCARSTTAQVDRYAALFDRVVDRARARRPSRGRPSVRGAVARGPTRSAA